MIALRRGDVVICTSSAAYGTPRPAVVVQANPFNQAREPVVLYPMTSELTGLELFRGRITSSEASGLRIRIRHQIGRLTAAQLRLIDAALRTWLDLPELT